MYEEARPGYKFCSECGIEKPEEQFYGDGYTCTGKKKRRPECKVCFQKNRRASQKKKIERGEF
jgi:hypothetical protein